jgi:mannose-1-phosphate guanylyltransferase/mannose-6-phosphate isomerase
VPRHKPSTLDRYGLCVGPPHGVPARLRKRGILVLRHWIEPIRPHSSQPQQGFSTKAPKPQGAEDFDRLCGDGANRKGGGADGDVGWSDVGEWSSVWRLSPRDANGNSLRGRAVVIDSSNVLVRSEEQLAAVIGLQDVVVVATGDAVLVALRSQTAKVKKLVERRKAEGHLEAAEHRRNYRPWGYYQSVDQGSRYQVKRIVVRPGGRLFLQKQHHRAEHWVVVRGCAEVTLNGKVEHVHENESIYLPIGSTHRLGNPGKIDLELIEVQTGSYFGEDDILRIEDDFNRM